jgi:hypothetical protein
LSPRSAPAEESTDNVYVAGAAEFLDISAHHVRLKSNTGEIPCSRDVNGNRVFRLEDLRRVAKSRAIRRFAKTLVHA